ncbi:MAG: DUF4174 domain-containing protein [Psychromonas sp.]
MLSELTTLKWENRIILVNATQNKDNVVTLFEQNKVEINDRDIIWFVIKNGRVTTNFTGNLTKGFLPDTREKYMSGQGKVILIGKDGGIKSRRDSLDLNSIFLEIDAMPMRQLEMQNQ